MVWFVVNLITASAYSLAQKWQNETVANAQGDKFDHPFFQTMIQCIGNMGAFLLYFVKRRFFTDNTDEALEKEQSIKKMKDNLQTVDESTIIMEMSISLKEKEPPKKINPFLFAIPAWLDAVESSMKNIATTMIA
jgi:hypothetical protein